MTHRPLRLLSLVAVAATTVMLGACASNQANTKAGAATASPKDAKAIIKQRAAERWKLLIAHKGAKAWDYLTPGYRATISREQYAREMNNRPVRWSHVNVTKVDCASAVKCEAYVIVFYKLSLPGMPGGKSFAPLKATWLQLQNQWYYLPRESE